MFQSFQDLLEGNKIKIIHKCNKNYMIDFEVLSVEQLWIPQKLSYKEFGSKILTILNDIQKAYTDCFLKNFRGYDTYNIMKHVISNKTPIITRILELSANNIVHFKSITLTNQIVVSTANSNRDFFSFITHWLKHKIDQEC